MEDKKMICESVKKIKVR